MSDIGQKNTEMSTVDFEAEYHISKARELAVLERYDEALVRFDRALAADPSHADAWHFKGVTLLYMDQPAPAKECLERALSLRPGNREILRQLKRVHRRLEPIDHDSQVPDQSPASRRPSYVTLFLKRLCATLAVLSFVTLIGSCGEEKAPTAACRDGSYSYAAHHPGACSHHGGVQAWYR